MTQKRKVLLATLVLIFLSGLMVTYKSHQVSREYHAQLEKQKTQDIAYWAAEVLMEKVKILEASVATLDKSTVQILKRMDVRYFAYAYKAGDQWKIKWKVIDGISKKQIVKEVNSIPFSELSSQKRNWFSENQKAALVSPVEVAANEQLKNGFLVFGLQPEFFSGVLDVDPQFEIFTLNGKQAKALVPNKKREWLIESGLINRDSPSQVLNLDHKGEAYRAASYFASDIQLWLVRLNKTHLKPFVASPVFRYFLMAMVLCFALVLVLFTQLISFSESLSAQKMRDTQKASPSLGLGALKRVFSKWGSSLSRSQEVEEDITPDQNWLDGVDLSHSPDQIEDLSSWVESLLETYKKRIVQNGIQLHVNIPEGLGVRFHEEPTREFIRRLVENSLQTLILEDDKNIHIDAVEESGQWTLSYRDSRTRHLPAIKDPTYLLEIENPLEDINGIMSYGRWLFAGKVHSSTHELSVDLKLEKLGRVLSQEDLNSVSMDRIVIDEEDEISLEQFDFKPVNPASKETVVGTQEAEVEDQEYLSQSIDDIVNSFEMNSFDFEEPEAAVDSDAELKEVMAAEKEVVQFEAGGFKLKIRAPKKRDEDVNY